MPLDGVVSAQYRFLKKNRLTAPEEYKGVFNSGKRSIDSQFVVLARKNGLGYSRLGMAISKSKVRGAVTRNSIKRLVRESFRRCTVTPKGYDIVVLPQRKINTADRELLRQSLITHWHKLSK